MKKFLIILAFLTCFQAKAGLIDITSDQVDSQIGDIITINLTGYDFDPFNFFVLGFTFDTSLYELVSDSLSSDLALADETAGGLGLRGTKSPENDGTRFNFFQLVQYTPSADSFTLASFQLKAIDVGQNAFNTVGSFFAGSNGPIEARAGHPLHTTVTATSVPEPATLALLILGFAGLIARKNKNCS